jgi:hypothetical protein
MINYNENRYDELTKGKTMPLVKLPINKSDKYIFWNSMLNRYDKISQKYYNSPFYDYLLIYANTEYLSEFDIPEGALIRIPFPLNKAKADYEALLKYYNNL